MDTADTSRIVIIMRGWPGSGKSTLANSIQNYFVSQRKWGPIVSADFGHINVLTKKYDWKQENSTHAYWFCRRTFDLSVRDNDDFIIVDNTNIKKHEYEHYIKRAEEYGYKVYQAIPNNPDMWDVQKCFERNVHNVPLETIQRMKDSFEDDNRFERFVLPGDGQEGNRSVAANGSQS